MTKRAGYEITAEDKTRAGIESAKKNFKELGDSALNLKGVFGAALGAISAGAVTSAFKNVLDGADSMGKLSQATGIAVEQLSGLNYAAKMSDVETETLGSSLKKLAKNAVDTANGTGEAKDAFAALGISVRDSAGKVRGSGDLLNQLADKFAGLEDGSEKTALAMQIFGKSGAQLIPLLNEGSAGISAFAAEAAQLGLVISQDLSDNADALNDNLDRMGFAVQGALIQAFSSSIPVVNELAEMMLEFAHDTEAVKSAGEAANSGLKLLVSGGIIVKSVFQQLGTLIGGVFASIGQAINGDFKAAADILKESYGDAVDNASRDIERMAKVWNAAGTSAKKASNDTAAAGNTTTTVLNRTGKAAKDADKALKEYEKSLGSLIDELDPNAKATREYMEQVALLDRAWIEGKISGEEYDRLMMLLATNTKAVEERQKDLIKAQEEAAKKREELAKEEAEAMRRPFEHAAEGVQDAFTGAFEDIFSGNVRSFSDLAGEIKGVFVRLAAEIATLMVFNPRASFGSVIGGTGLFGSGAASAGAQLAGGGLNPLSAVSSFLGPAGSILGLGGLGGGLIGSLTGGNTLGSSVGGALGAYGGVLAGSGILGGATGALVGSLGQLGNYVIPGLGLVLGALSGGLLGNKQPSNASAFANIDLRTGQLAPAPTERNSTQETRAARDSIVEAIVALRNGIVSATGGRLSGNVQLDVGQRDGIQAGGWGRYANPQDAVAGIFRGMLDNLQGVDAQFRQVFRRLDLSDLEKAISDLGVAAAIINKDYVQSEPLSAAAVAIKSIRDNFAPIIEQARALGLAVAPIRAEANRQVRELRADANADIQQAILAITNPMRAELKAFDAMARDRLQNYRDLGVSAAQLTQVERLNALERQRIVEKYGQAANDSLSQLITQLGRTGLTPAATVASLGGELDSLFDAADRPGANLADLANRATQLAPQYVQALQGAYASGPQFQQLFSGLMQMLTQLQTKQNGGTLNIKVVTVDGRTLTEHTLEQIQQRSANGEIVISARGVGA